MDGVNSAKRANRLVTGDLPSSVLLADQLVGLDKFLEDAALGFHWDMLEQMEDGVYIVDPQRRIRYWSLGAERITGYSAQEVLGHCCADNLLIHVDARGINVCVQGCPLAAVLADGRSRSADVFLRHKDGHRVPVRIHAAAIRDWHGKVIGVFETFSDTSELAAELERIRVLEAVAHLDHLTGLPNRRSFDNELSRRLSEFIREGLRFGLIMVDVDHFKQFNDECGHDTGDEVLKMIACTLSHACRAYDFVTRWGGEEFAILTGCCEAEKVSDLAERLRALVEHSALTHAGQILFVTVSIGATSVRNDDDAGSLLTRTDALLYGSKSAGRNQVTYVQ